MEVGTEHLIVRFVDKVLQLLDSSQGRTAVISAAVDWQSAFDRIDPTCAVKKFLSLGVRVTLIPLLISYLTGRQMIVKYDGAWSKPRSLVGGVPQGSILAGTEYLVTSDDCPPVPGKAEDTAEAPEPIDKYSYYDDLNTIELLILSELLVEYDFRSHVASDIGLHNLFLPPQATHTQEALHNISEWTKNNLMRLNESKSNYIIFTRTKQEFSSRLKLNDDNLERVSVTKILGVWLQEDLKWEENTKQICIKAYSRVSILCKLKYVGICIEDLLTIYMLFIRSVTEYCSVVFHSGLTEAQTNKLESIQRTCLRVILAKNYVSYEAALEMCNLQRLETRRESRLLTFSLRCIKNQFNSHMFPLNLKGHRKEKFKVNFARTSAYKNSCLVKCQEALNEHFKPSK